MGAIIVDYRAGSGELVDYLARMVNCSVEKDTLSAGDVAFEGCGPDGDIMVGIECKRIEEYLGSMRTGRMAEQAGKMQDAYDINYLIIQGVWRANEQGVLESPYKDRGKTVWAPIAPISREQIRKGQKRRVVYHYSEMEKHIITLENKRGFRVKRVSSRTELLQMITTVIHAYYQKPWASHTSADAIKLQPLGIRYTKASQLRLVAPQFHGIGATRADAVTKTFKTVERAVLASVDEWEAIPNIGRKTAERIWCAIRSED